MDVSIIIVNWNTQKLLQNCLESVYAHAGNVDFEIIVIDNASTDGSADMVRDNFKNVVLIENRENRGFAGANNQGIAVAKGRYVLLLNSDTVVLDNAVENTVRFADENPSAAVVGCKVLNSDGTLQPTCFMFPSILNMMLSCSYLSKLFPRNRFWGREKMTWWDRSDVREVDVVTGCFMLVRREAIERIGVMDDRFFMYCEETDWCYRFKKDGWNVIFAPVGRIIHLGGQSTAKNPVAMLVQLRLSILKFIRKHYGWTAHLLARLLTVLFFSVRLPVWFATALLTPSKRAAAKIKMQAYSRGIVNALFG